GGTRLPGGAPALVDLRHPDGGRDQDRAVRRRGTVLRHPARPGPGVAPVAAVLAPREPHLRRGPPDRRAAARGRLHPRRARQPAGRRRAVTMPALAVRPRARRIATGLAPAVALAPMVGLAAAPVAAPPPQPPPAAPGC